MEWLNRYIFYLAFGLSPLPVRRLVKVMTAVLCLHDQ